ncbi:hypothetical protein [Nocardia jiangxiensis]|uniref:hypothetical protein n=1 Tax=Nocardia jiangxiensis TaxID=282685 RepID=UPI0002D880F6|nr:hypothetical protein [Nocardia jiangxiensis]
MIAKLLTHQFHWPDVVGLVAAYWPLLAVLAGMLAFVVSIVWVCVRRWRAREAARAVWLDIEVPASVTAEAAGVFARRMAGGLHRTRRVGVAARHVVLEIVATAAGARMGVWVPPRMNPGVVTAALTDAWPGAKVTVTTPPALAGRAMAVEVTARNGVWAPWTGTRLSARTGPAPVPDPLSGVLGRLCARPAGETGFVQLVLAPYYRRTLPKLLGKALGVGLSELLALVRTLYADPRTSTSVRPAPAASLPPLAAARQSAETAKMAAGPHLSATLRVGLVSEGPVPRRDAVWEIEGGFDAIADAAVGGLRSRRVWSGHRVLVRRPGRTFIATVSEVAALWHLPADAARFGLPVVHARTRTARPSVPRLGHPAPPSRTTPPPVAGADKRAPRPGQVGHRGGLWLPPPALPGHRSRTAPARPRPGAGSRSVPPSDFR